MQKDFAVSIIFTTFAINLKYIALFSRLGQPGAAKTVEKHTNKL